MRSGTKKDTPQQQQEGPKKAVSEILKNNVQGAKVDDGLFEKVTVDTFVQESISVAVVTVPAALQKALKKSHSAAVESLEKVLGGTVFIIRKRKCSGLVKGERRFRTGPTYKDYQESVAKDLVAPYHVVDRRTVIREDGSQVEKVIVESRGKKELVNRFVPMGIVFEKLFEKKALFQENYY